MRVWLGTGLALAAVAAMAGFGAAQDRPAPQREAPGIPGVQAVSIENLEGRAALLVVTASRGPDLPTRFEFPFEENEVLVNDEGRDGDRRAGDGLYSGRFRFDDDRFARTLRANAERLPTEALVSRPALSTRFTPITSGAPRRVGASAAPGGVIAPTKEEVVQREQGLMQVRRAIDLLASPAAERPGELLRVERVRGELRAQLLGQPVPIGVIIPPSVLPSQINPDKSLVITDLAVVRDPTRTFDPCGNAGNPNGVWTFKHLITQMANQSATGISPAEFAKHWLTLSAFPQEANNFISPPRPTFVAQVRNAWLAQSGGTTLDLDKAPFRLLAIVARPDLGAAPAGYNSGSAGELRFVFGVLRPTQPCAVQQSTVIFEYAVPIKGCNPTKAWIQKWFNLSAGGLILGSPAYNQQVETLTQQVVVAGANPAQLPNRNAISQIRTNDLIGGRPWILFEYRLDTGAQSNPGHLDLVTVKQTPDLGFRVGVKLNTLLRPWMIANQADILNNRHTVPTTLPNGDPFLGARAPTASPSFTWVSPAAFAPPLTPTIVSNFSVATCNGCHAGDTGTAFTHIKPRPALSVAALSSFMRNSIPGVEDDLERRQRFMADALNAPCFVIHLAQNLPPAFVH